MKKFLSMLIVLSMVVALVVPVTANPGRTGGFTEAEETFGAVAAAVVTRIPGNMNQLDITVSIDGQIVAEATFMIPNNSAGEFRVGGFKVFVSTFGNTNIDTIFITHAECGVWGHQWCGVTGNFVQRPGPGVWTDHMWWYEICSRDDCGYALPLADIYLQFLEPGERGHATGSIWDANRGRSWSLVPEDIKDRLIHTFNVRWKDIVDWMDFGIVSRIEYVLDSQGVGWASGRRSGMSLYWITANPWDTDLMTHELIHNAQRFSNVPMWVHEGHADYARAKFGLFNEQSGWRLPPFGMDSMNPSTLPNSGFISGYVAGYGISAAFYRWIAANFNPNFVQELNYSLKAELVTNFQPDVLDVLEATTGVRGVPNPGGQGRYYADGRQFAWLTGIDVEPVALAGNRSTVVNALWAKYMEYSFELASVEMADWIPGFSTLEEAAGGRTVMQTATFVDGGLGFGNNGTPFAGESAFRLFDGLLTTKYCANVITHGGFWAIWSYTEAFVADRFIWATANDNLSLVRDRRMGDGWTLSGSNDGVNWTVLYIGTRDEYSNFNFTFYYADLDNDQAFRYYKLNSDTAGCSADIVQLSIVALTGIVPVAAVDTIEEE